VELVIVSVLLCWHGKDVDIFALSTKNSVKFWGYGCQKKLKEVIIESGLNISDGGILTQLLCSWSLSTILSAFKTRHFGDRIQSPKCVFLNKNRTMDNVEKHNIIILLNQFLPSHTILQVIVTWSIVLTLFIS
jgi:hypothetical protein